jgi:feruloyl-CoA synthase
METRLALDRQWVEAAVSVEETGDGSLILGNKIPLDSYPNNLVTWLPQNAAVFPDKAFLQERNAAGEWEGMTYAQTAMPRI